MSYESAAVIQPFPEPKLRPFQWTDVDEPLFQPEIHLAPWDLNELRKSATTINGMYQLEPSHPVPEHLNNAFAFSKTFRVLSEEGYRIARAILEREYDNGFVQPDRRIQLCLRGVTYRSPFLRAFSESPRIRELACALTGENLCIHGMISNHAHINWGVPHNNVGEIKSVDQWHQDSVSHVLIVLMSEMEESEGGVLGSKNFVECCAFFCFFHFF